jgi:copper transport protein
VLALILAAGFLWGAASPTQAHAVLARSVPANGAALAEAPRSVELWFTEPVARHLASATLLDSAGRTVPGAELAEVGESSIRVELPVLGNGTFSVLWRVLSRNDGHASTGALVFVVGPSPTGALGTAAGAASASNPLPWAAVAARWLVVMAYAAWLGALVIAAVLGLATSSPARLSPARRDVARRLERLARCAVALALAASAAELVVKASALTSPRLGLPSVVAELVAHSSWGLLWVLRVALLATACLVLWHPGHSAPGWSPPVLGLLVTLLLGLDAASGHTASLATGRVWATVVMTAHVAAACAWIGGLLALALVVSAREASGPSMVRAAAVRLALVFGTSAVLLAVTGLHLAGRQIPWVADLVSTAYGRVLLVKAVLVLALGMVAAVTATRLGGVPGLPLTRPRRVPGVRRVLAEAVLGLLVLGAAAALAQTPPARESASPQQPVQQSTSRSKGDLVLALSGTPSTPGPNAFTAQLASTRRPDPAPVQSVALRVQGSRASGQVAMTRTTGGEYFATASLPPTGAMTVTVMVERAGAWVDFTIPWSLAEGLGPPEQGPALAPAADAVATGLLVLGGTVCLVAAAGRIAGVPGARARSVGVRGNRTTRH